MARAMRMMILNLCNAVQRVVGRRVLGTIVELGLEKMSSQLQSECGGSGNAGLSGNGLYGIEMRKRWSCKGWKLPGTRRCSMPGGVGAERVFWVQGPDEPRVGPKGKMVS